MKQAELFQKYCIDTCAILEFWDEKFRTRPYHVKVKTFRVIWEYIASKVQSGEIVILQAVADEIIEGNLELLEWINKHKKLYRDYSPALNELAMIVNKYNIFTQKGKASLSDAIIVAYAKKKNLIVVTSEEHPQNPSPVNPKIPTLCDEFGVAWIHLPEFFEKEGL